MEEMALREKTDIYRRQLTAHESSLEFALYVGIELNLGYIWA